MHIYINTRSAVLADRALRDRFRPRPIRRRNQRTLMLYLFATILGPILVFLITWIAATAYRIYFPEEPLPFEHDPVVVREKATRAGQSVPVGVREIRADQRRKKRQDTIPYPEYHYARGWSDGFPDVWREDLWRRRN